MVETDDNDNDSILDDDTSEVADSATDPDDNDLDDDGDFYDDDDSVDVLGVQPNEYVCERCFLVVHRSCGNGVVCADCLGG